MECLIRKPREREVAKVERKERFRRQRRPGVHIFFLRSLSQKEGETEREGTRVSSFSFFFLARSGSDFLHHTLEEKSWSREKLGAQKSRLSISKALENRRLFFDHRSIFLKKNAFRRHVLGRGVAALRRPLLRAEHALPPRLGCESGRHAVREKGWFVLRGDGAPPKLSLSLSLALSLSLSLSSGKCHTHTNQNHRTPSLPLSSVDQRGRGRPAPATPELGHVHAQGRDLAARFLCEW